MSSSRLSSNMLREISRLSASKIQSSHSSLIWTNASRILSQNELAANSHLKFIRIHFSVFSQSVPSMETMKIKVPTMGDSITEGTIVEWTVGVGGAVKEGDVVALVETDKVTVDIKAEADGVIVSQYGSVDDTIEVGADLYQLDTEGVATTAPVTDSASENKVAELEISENNLSFTVHASENKESSRIPSIHFLGKEGWEKRRAKNTNAEAQNQSQSIQVFNLDPMYGRPEFSEQEMEALLSGGANLAPKLELFSSS